MPTATKPVQVTSSSIHYSTSTKTMTKLGVYPLLDNTALYSYSTKHEHMQLPPTPICESINSQIRQNPLHPYPTFDFKAYAAQRSYTLSTINFSGDSSDKPTTACFLDDSIHDTITSLFPTLRPPSSFLSSNMFEIKETGTIKGRGMFSNYRLTVGQTILEEHPTIVTPYLLGISLPLREMYTELFELLPKNILAQISSLATSSSSTNQGKGLPDPSFYEDIMHTNALAIQLPIPSSSYSYFQKNPNILQPEIPIHRALFLSTSRCNHSCSPNATWSFSPNTLKLTLTALRTIEIGEEITIEYIPVSSLVETGERRENLKEVFGFECCCEKCLGLGGGGGGRRGRGFSNSTNGDSSWGYGYEEESDEYGWVYDKASDDEDIDVTSDEDPEIEKELPTFEEWCSNPSIPENLLIMANKRALQSHLHFTSSTSSNVKTLDEHIEAIAMCYAALSDVNNFKKWITIVQEARLNPTTPNGEPSLLGQRERKTQTIVFENWISNPSSFPCWGWRRKSVVGGRR